MQGKENTSLTNTEQTRFAALRAKTDRELAILIDKRLRFAVTRLQSSARGRLMAEEVYAEAGALIPLIYQLPAKQRNQLEVLRAGLWTLLQDRATFLETRAYAAL